MCADGDTLVLSDGQVYQPADASFLRVWRASAADDPCERLDGDVILTVVA
jgi:hypothetical protein